MNCFVKLLNKARSLYTNLDTNSYVKNLILEKDFEW